MSRLTRPFHKSSRYDLPRPVHPLSPPDTDITADSVQLPPMNIVPRDMGLYTDPATSSYTKVDSAEHYHPASSEAQRPSGHFRRTSNLTYHPPVSLRHEARSAPRSATRWLVMVFPPSAVSREHGSSIFLEATARASHAVLMPLLPSLSGQLSAIAREFSFPSTTGICIYLHMADGGVQFAPRVSDESWSILWGSAFDERQTTNSMGGLPVAGRIEFDLDLRKARWFDMWVTACRRELDVGLSAPASVAHRRDESRTTFAHEQPEESIADDISVTIQRKVPIIRHVPRKLSLLDRIDVSSLRPASRSSRNALSPTRAEEHRLVLSPVAQLTTEIGEDEPQTAIQRVEKKVQKWRASSSFAKSPLVTSTGQTALDPTNMPNNVPLADSDVDINVDGMQPLDLDDFTWSVTSAGPLSPEFEPNSALFSDQGRVPSVHLDRRLEGSICLTPTTCTSFGPPDYDVTSPVSSLISRLPSPDIAERCVDYAPLTPSTATSWGPPSEWPGSPALSYRAPSVDIAARYLGSRPVTPSTATSWGAPVEYPASPATPSYIATPGIGSMHFDDGYEEETLLQPGRVLRSFGAGGQEPREHTLRRNEDGDAGVKAVPWRLVWPYRRASEPEVLARPLSTRLDPGYPLVNIYPAVYPHFDLYPVCPDIFGSDNTQPWQCVWPYNASAEKTVVTSPWNRVWPYQRAPGSDDTTTSIDVRLNPGYPSISLYPAAYPYFDLYPSKPDDNWAARGVNMKVDAKYPVFSIYPAVYPAFEIYPGYVIEPQRSSLKALPVRLPASYPFAEIYSPVYPHFDIYPVKVASFSQIPASTRQLPQKTVSSPIKQQVISVRLDRLYPVFDLYPASYPDSLNDIYPCVQVDREDDHLSVKLPTRYPYLDIYPAVYPFFNLYPAVQKGPEQSSIPQAETKSTVLVNLKPKYPHIDLYPPVYPHFSIYPALPSPPVEKSVTIVCEARYPNFDIYPAVYPYFDIYRAGKASISEYWREPCSVRLDVKYPDFDLYPVVYPFLDIYNTGSVSDPVPLANKLSVRLEASYPAFDIYPAVYTHFQLYPAIQPAIQASPRLSRRKTHRELCEIVFSQSATFASPPAPLPLSGLPEISGASKGTAADANHLSIPTRPSEVRRSVSLNRPSKNAPAGGMLRSVSLRHLPAVTEGASRSVHPGHRASHVGELHDSVPGGEVAAKRLKSRRDSIILEKARHWNAPGSVSVPLQRDSLRSALNDQSGVPLPPMPSNSELPNGRRGPINQQRPVSKLDRTKFPFH
ncbi:hypothetical protein M0805_005444 [Coniferiporia weirii]|nr:hypothetical protein M0805_005444 [Coniferiporia weirii]